jgi:nitroreductase
MSVLADGQAARSENDPSALETRRSIRQYLDKPIPEELLRRVLTEARWAPSTINSQSTFVFALSGRPFEEFKAELLARSEDNVPAVSDVSIGGPWTPAQEARIKAFRESRSTWCAAEEKRLGVEPEIPPSNPSVGGARVHGAPTLLVLAFDKTMSAGTGCFDAGAFAMAITLAAQDHGLGTCIVFNPVRYSDLMRKYIPGLEDKNVVIGIAIGYPDYGAIVNRFPRSRMLSKEYLTFVE